MSKTTASTLPKKQRAVAPQSKTKVGKKALNYVPPKAKKQVTPFEDFVHFAGMVRFKLRGLDIGAYCLKKKDTIQLKFGFDCTGVHPSLPCIQVPAIFEAIESGLKDLPDNETLTIHATSFTTDWQRQAQLKAVQDHCDSAQLQLLVGSDRLRVRELTEAGIRKPKTLRLYCTYTVDGDAEGTSQDALGKILLLLAQGWKAFTGQIHEHKRQQLETIFLNSFTDGFQLWEQLLATKMGLSIQPMTAQQLWSDLWTQFNFSDPPPIPHILTLDDRSLTEKSQSDFHICHHLLERESSVPFFDRAWVRLKNRYIGVLSFTDKPAGWRDEYAQLRYLWQVLSRERVYDTQIIAQFSRANEALAKTAVQRITKQSIVGSELAISNASVDVGAQLKAEKAIAAQAEMIEGAVPINTAVVFLVHRRDTRSLAEACRYLSSCFRRPAVVVREKEYAWKLWLQCLPIVLEKLLAKPFDRRLTYFSSEAPGLMPLVTTAAVDESGFELIADEGGTPLHLDLYQKHKNLGVFATTRAGKSVLVSGILTQALAQGMPVVALDYPKPDGTSTFTDYTQFFGSEDGAYFDIGSQSSNLFEIPDTRALPDIKTRKERMADYKDFLATALFAMVLGTNLDGVNPLLVDSTRAVIGLALETFFNDADIKLRYQQARERGFGTPEWENIPTLQDFSQFCAPGFLDLDALGKSNSGIDALTALDQIQIKLRFWLTSSRVGKAISRPSTFRSDARLLVFALRNLSNDADAAILSLSAYSAALRRALASPASIFFIDESPILFNYPSIAELVGRLCANGAKSGVRVILSAQDPETISNSAAASKIFANMTTRLIGVIQPSAVKSFVDIFQYPVEIISRNSTDAFFPKKEGLYSQWLLDNNGKLTSCRYYPAYCQLAAVANNPDEQEWRSAYLQNYKHNPLEGMVRFSEAYVNRIRGQSSE